MQLLVLAQYKTLDMHKLYAHSFLSCTFILGKRMGLQEPFEFVTGCSTYGPHLHNTYWCFEL
jgi:hypothetical protein